MSDFESRVRGLLADHEQLVLTPNAPAASNGVYERWQNPVLTAGHTPVFWRYDLNPNSNPYLMERQGVKAAFNAGAIYWQGRYVLVARVEGDDRKSFFAVAESPNGVDNFRFWDHPIPMPETD